MIKEINAEEMTLAKECMIYLNKHHNEVSDCFKGCYPHQQPDEKIRMFQDDLMSGKSRAAMAFENDKAVGLIKIDVDRCKNYGLLDYFVVLPQAQGKGYGQQLMDWALSAFKENEIQRIEIHVVYGNKTVEFYRKNGFDVQSYIMENRKTIHPDRLLESERLYFREMNDDDFDALRKIITDDETMQYYPAPYQEEGVNRWLQWNKNNYQDYGFGLWAACLKESGEMIGDCGITIQKINGKFVPEIGYHLNKEYWHRGLGKEAAKAALNWAFIHTPFNTLYSYMNSENLPSVHTAMAMGMKEICHYMDDDELILVYAITREEWAKMK